MNTNSDARRATREARAVTLCARADAADDRIRRYTASAQTPNEGPPDPGSIEALQDQLDDLLKQVEGFQVEIDGFKNRLANPAPASQRARYVGPTTPNARPIREHPSDHVGEFPEAYDPERMAIHRKAIRYLLAANERGLKPTYAAAILEVTRRPAAVKAAR